MGQPSTQNSSSLSPETSRVTGSRKQAASSSTTGETSSSVGRKRTRDMGFNVYTDTQSGRQVLNPERSSERVISSGTTLKDASLTNVDLGFKTPRLKSKEKDAMTENQLQQMQQRK
ncbi:putative nuclear transcription factor Y subunit A-1-like isoform X1 [Capsicum annuum]|nr:putative nuclear transcription factor Y subunit A-1-like isoform X1 [Capsicum annuum]KAF3638705.1 putative nuclear transcription factor Y subunit A-1-like isoform X1 [Capsicum annuum]